MKIEKYKNPSVYTFLFSLNNSLDNKSIDCNALKLLNLEAQPLHDLYNCSISSKESFPLSKSLLRPFNRWRSLRKLSLDNLTTILPFSFSVIRFFKKVNVFVSLHICTFFSDFVM